jgi:hypothetical protein
MILTRVVGGSSMPASATDTITISGALTKPDNLAPNLMSNAPLSGGLLTWTGADYLPKEIYFGTVQPMPIFASNVYLPIYPLPSLSPCTTYFWNIIARNDAGSTAVSSTAVFSTIPSVSLSPSYARLPVTGGSSSIQVGSPSECGWSAQSGDVTISPSSGLHDGTINFTAQTNFFPVAITHAISIADKIFWIRQDAAPCTYSLSGPAFIDASVQTINFAVTAGAPCMWYPLLNHYWMIINSSLFTGSGNFDATAQANTSGAPRTIPLSVVVDSGVTSATPATLSSRSARPQPLSPTSPPPTGSSTPSISSAASPSPAVVATRRSPTAPIPR